MKSNWKKLHITLKIGLIIFLIGSGPFFIVMGLDALGIISPGNLALGTGPLVFISFWPSIILIIIGIVRTYLKGKKQNKKFANTK